MAFASARCTLLSGAADLESGEGETPLGSEASIDGAADATTSDVTEPKDVAVDTFVPPDGSLYFAETGHTYLVVVTEDGGALRWTDARDRAVALGGHLATITSNAENEFVYELSMKTPGAWWQTVGPWIGGFQSDAGVEPGGGFQWVTGEPWGFEAWDDGEPNDEGDDEDYVHFYSETGQLPYWNDSHDVGQSPSFVVEFE